MEALSGTLKTARRLVTTRSSADDIANTGFFDVVYISFFISFTLMLS